MAWISPTGHDDSDEAWLYEVNAYDDDTETYAYNSATNYDHYLELTIAAILCDKVRIYAQDSLGAPSYDPDLDIDVYYGSAWHNIWSGVITKNTWIEKAIGSSQLVTAARVKSNTSGVHTKLYEFDFGEALQVETDACSDIAATSLQANGDVVCDGGSTVTRRGFHYSKVFDDFEWGSDTDPLDDSGGAITWTILAPGTNKVEIDTSQHYSGTRSVRMYRASTDYPAAWFTQSPMSATQVASIRYRRTGNGYLGWVHGNGSYIFYVGIYHDGRILYYDTEWRDTGYEIPEDEWHHFTVQNVNWVSHTFDIYLDGICIKTGAGMQSNANYGGVIRFGSSTASAEFWLDDVGVWDVEDEEGEFEEGEYDLEISGLDSNAKYYVQALAENADGIAYGNVVDAIVPVVASCPVGIVTASSRTLGGSRAGSTAVGLVSSAVKSLAKIVSVSVGLVTAASRTLAGIRASSSAVGLLTSASRLLGITRIAETVVGLITSAFGLVAGGGVAVQRGLISLEGTTLSDEVTLDTPVDVGHSFVIASIRSNKGYCEFSLARVELSAPVSGQWTKVKATRNSGGTFYDCYVEWQVISGDALVVQTGEETFANLNTTETAAIAEVDTDKAFIVLSNSTNTRYSSRSFIRAKFNSSTEIQFDRGLDGYSPVVRWYVVEWDGAAIQSGLVTVTSTSGTDTISEVDLTQSAIFYTHYTTSLYNGARAFIRGRFSSTTQVEFTRGQAALECYVSYFAISNPGFLVQSDTATITGTSDTYTLSPPVVESASFMPTPLMGNAYSDATDSDTLDHAFNTHKLFEDGADSKVTIERTTSDNNLYPSYFVVTTSRAVIREIFAAVVVGLATTASYVLGATRTASVAVGLVTSALRGFIKQASVAVGTVVTASRTLAAQRLSAVASGIVAFATSIYEGGGAAYWVLASTVVGLATTASRTLGATRNSSAVVGLVTAASKIFGKIISSSVVVGIATSATKGVAVFTRTASLAVGLAISATRSIAASRAASVIVGLAVSAFGGVIVILRAVAVAGRLYSTKVIEGGIHATRTIASRIYKTIVKEK